MHRCGASPAPVFGAVADLVTQFSDRAVVVVGDVVLDEWRWARAHRLCREAPAPVLTVRGSTDAAGGAGNTAANLARLGARAVLVAPVGDDSGGRRVRDAVARHGVRDRTVTATGYQTPVKRRLVADGQIVVREDTGGTAPAPDAAVAVIDTLKSLLRGERSPVLCVCDYGLGAVSDPVRQWLIAHRDHFATVALDAHRLERWRGLAPTLVTPSFAEAAEIWGLAPGPVPDRTQVTQARIEELVTALGADIVAVTLDVDGAIVADAAGRLHRTCAHPAPASHAVGAGDAYLAAMTLAVASGAPLRLAAETAQLAAAVTVTDVGTCVCDRDAVLAAAVFSGSGSKRMDRDAVVALVRARRAQGARVVFTNGCFDVLHRGHVAYLEEGRRLGDLLIVAVNSDASVRRLKGPQRPVNQEEDRAAVLAALSCVDAVVVFDGDSPADLIEAVRPDVYVKGGDYPPEMVPEAPLVRRLGGEVRVLSYVPDRSTSAIIDRIRSRGSSAVSR